jgi:predicted TPR repeat methyltransferase
MSGQLWRESICGMTQRIIPRVYRSYFEYLYTISSDPWEYGSSAYETAKYCRTINAMEGRTYSRALEVGCSTGIFTEMLAPHCEEITAVDISALAVRRARRRLVRFSHVDVRRRTLPEHMPQGPYDLIICSEVLYYWSPGLLEDALRAFEAALSPGGVLLAVHGRFESHTCPLTGDEVHDLLQQRFRLHNSFSVAEPRYRLDRFEKTSIRA